MPIRVIGRESRSSTGGRGRRPPERGVRALVGAALAVIVAALVGGCAPSPRASSDQTAVAATDTVLGELGGPLAQQMDRGQRWRMVASIGAGLPPRKMKPEELPEPDSRWPALMEAYCTQCHWLPDPRMHGAREWPVLMRRMLLRARTLQARIGGPLVRGALGDVLTAGISSVTLPSPEDLDSLTAYLQRHALPVAAPGEIPSGPDAQLFARTCSQCHDTPSPQAHTSDEWGGVVSRMRHNIALVGLDSLSQEDAGRITSFLQSQAKSGEPADGR